MEAEAELEGTLASFETFVVCGALGVGSAGMVVMESEQDEIGCESKNQKRPKI